MRGDWWKNNGPHEPETWVQRPPPHLSKKSMSLILQPIILREANAFVKRHHRHHVPVQGAKFAIACTKEGKLVGVVIVGRPVSRHMDDGFTAEVTRLCTDGTYNACSLLYGAAWRAARAMGYTRMITYTLESEDGSSLKAANFHFLGFAGGGNWNKPGRSRADTPNLLQCQKRLWEIGKQSSQQLVSTLLSIPDKQENSQLTLSIPDQSSTTQK